MGSSVQIRRLGSFAIVVLCAAALLTPTLARPAAAASAATIRSATVKVGGETLTIDVVVNSRATHALDGPIKVVITLAGRTAGKVVSVDGGFNDDGWSIEFRRGARADTGVVSVTVPARTKRIPIEVDLAASSGWAVGVPGTTNVATAIPIYV